VREKIDAYWRAANYLSVGQMYLFNNPLLKRPLVLTDIKHMAARLTTASRRIGDARIGTGSSGSA